jgi:fructose-specific phosphotransferase system IIC component
MFHYGYFISALAYGFFAGLIRQLMLTNKKNNMFVSLISMTVFSVLACVVCGVYLYYMNNGEPYSISIFSLEIALPTLDVIGIMVGTILSVVAIC